MNASYRIRSRAPRPSVSLAALLCGAALLAPATLYAQDAATPTELSAGQQMLINEGARASNAGDYDRAIRLLRVSLDLREINVGYLNYGRALQKAGRCRDAREAYERALLAPPVTNPSPDKVRDIVQGYMKELGAVCPGALVVACKSDTIKVSVEGVGEFACEGRERTVKPGAYTVKATHKGHTYTRSVTVRAFETAHVHIPTMRPVAMVAKDRQVEGEALERSGDLGAAQSAFEEAHKTAPHWGPPMLHLGTLALRQKRYVQALKWLERYRAYAPPDELKGLDQLVARAEGELERLIGDDPSTAPSGARPVAQGSAARMTR